MADVAAAAGVSGQTVSRVVNASPRVDSATRSRVEAAMQRLGYRPHRAARALRTGRTQTIGLVASTLASFGNSRMLQAVVAAANARGFALTVVTATDVGGIASAFDQLRDQGVDGAIVLNEAAELARAGDVPETLALVVVDAPVSEERRFGIVQSDHVGGARAVVAHLLALGHRTVHFVGGPVRSFASSERERGWREELAAGGAPVPELVRGDWTSASGFAARIGRDATAVFAANDQMALGVLRALTESGRRVPEEISVAGFDDVPDAADYRPPLTTVRQDFDALGERALTALIARIEARPGHTCVVPTSLIVRDSTAAPNRNGS